VACHISLESPHHPSHTGQEMGTIGHVVKSYSTLSDFEMVKKSVFGRKERLKFFFAYNLLGYDEDNHYASSGEKTVIIGHVLAKKYFFYC
jgi:hypothetical protein